MNAVDRMVAEVTKERMRSKRLEKLRMMEMELDMQKEQKENISIFAGRFLKNDLI